MQSRISYLYYIYYIVFQYKVYFYTIDRQVMNPTLAPQWAGGSEEDL